MSDSLYIISVVMKTAGLFTAISGKIYEHDAFIAIGVLLLLASWYLLDYYYKRVHQ